MLMLGKGPAKIDSRTLRLASYLPEILPEAPLTCDWLQGSVPWGVMRNDELGNCTCAAVGHGHQVISSNTPDGLMSIPQGIVDDLYQKACGWVPGDPATDQGGIILDVLNYVRKNQFGSHVLFAYAAPDPGNVEHIKQAIFNFGAVDIGLLLPLTAQDQVGRVWDVVVPGTGSQPGSWGGHSVVVSAYDEEGLTCVTWGATQRMTWAFWRTYCDEAFALLFRMWMERNGGNTLINVAKLERDLATLRN